MLPSASSTVVNEDTVPSRHPDRRGAEFGLRALSATVLASVAVTITHLGGWWFAVPVLILAIAVLHEWHRLTDTPGFPASGAAAAAAWIAIAWQDDLAMALYALVMGMIGTAVFSMLRRREGKALWAAAGTAYTIVPMVVLVWMRSAEGSSFVLLWMFFVVWASDSGAYISGLCFGGGLLLPSVSPAKTWSGACGGLLASAAIGSAAATMIQAPIESALVLALAVSIAAQCGDLVQSAVKRRCGAKDSGRIVPGHGGLMDRLDSLVFAAPVFSLSWTVMTLLAADG